MDLDGGAVCGVHPCAVPVRIAVWCIVLGQGEREHAVFGIHRHRCIGFRRCCAFGCRQDGFGLQGALRGGCSVCRVLAAGAGVQSAVAAAVLGAVDYCVRVGHEG